LRASHVSFRLNFYADRKTLTRNLVAKDERLVFIIYSGLVGQFSRPAILLTEEGLKEGGEKR
jgi:hypothetical protein